MLTEIYRSIGHTAGVLEELTRHLSMLSDTLHRHIEEEAGTSAEVRLLSERSDERHERLNTRLDKLEKAAHRAAGARAILATIGAALIGIAAWGISTAISSKPLLDWLAKSFGIN